MKTWIARVRKVYCSLQELERYDALAGVVARCGFSSAAELWEANPWLGGSGDPADFGVVHESEPEPLMVKPLRNYKLRGTDIVLDKNRVYSASHATNQPEWQQKGKIFVEEVLLSHGEYTVIPDSNNNCLEGRCCPECGQTNRFRVWALSEFVITDEGTSDFGDVEYDEDSCASCPECGWKGKWGDTAYAL